MPEPEHSLEQKLLPEKLQSKQRKNLNDSYDNDDVLFVVPAPEQEPAPEEEPDSQIKQMHPTPQQRLLLGGEASPMLTAMLPLTVEEVISEDMKKQSGPVEKSQVLEAQP